jgi:hypothetical protein
MCAKLSKVALQRRTYAVDCWFRSKEQIGLACSLFRQKYDHKAVSNVSKFIHRWVNAFKTRGDVHDDKKAGRPEKLPKAAAQAAVEIVWQGYTVDGQQEYWGNIQAALDGSPQLKAIQTQHKVTTQTLWRRMLKVQRRLKKRTLEVRRKLSAANMKQRVASARQLLGWAPRRLRRVFFLDAATIYMVPKGCKVLAPPEARLVIEDERLNSTKRMQKIKFYACVSPVFGPVMLKFMTGTTGLKHSSPYLVSWLGLPLPCLAAMAQVFWVVTDCMLTPGSGYRRLESSYECE